MTVASTCTSPPSAATISFRNQCDGTFTDVPAAGVNDVGWSVSAAFLDFDRDGWLDLYVGHYLNWDPSMNTPCFGPSGARVYCAPAVYVPQQSQLFRNQRDGTFMNVTADSRNGCPVWPRAWRDDCGLQR